jgi:hypothetical protein
LAGFHLYSRQSFQICWHIFHASLVLVQASEYSLSMKMSKTNDRNSLYILIATWVVAWLDLALASKLSLNRPRAGFLQRGLSSKSLIGSTFVWTRFCFSDDVHAETVCGATMCLGSVAFQ